LPFASACVLLHNPGRLHQFEDTALPAPGADLPDTPAPAPRLPQGRARAVARWATPRTVVALMLREMSTRYGRQPGGYIWAVVEPLAGIFVLAIGFSLLMRGPPLGTSFILFKATGMMPFLLYMGVVNAVSYSVQFSRPLLAYPAVTWLDMVLARFILNTLTHLLVSYLVLAGILLATGTRTVLDFGDIGLSMGLAAALGLGIGCLNCFLFLRFPVWEQAWAILNRPIFLISGIIFLYESMPQVAQDILWWNPLMHVTGVMRAGFYPTYEAAYVSVGFMMTCALLPMVAGLMLLRRHHQDLVNT
jgi:capsular polysaccharide transport system permease protein